MFNHIAKFTLITIFSLGSIATVSAADRAINFGYKGYSAGILAAKSSGTLDMSNGRYLISLQGRDAGISSLFKWGSQVDATGGLFPQGVAPERFNLQNRRKGRSSSRAVNYANGQATVVFGRPPSIPPNEVITPSQTSGSVDPAAAFIAVLNSVEQNGSCSFSIKVYEGKSLYRFDVRRVGTESVSNRKIAYSGNAVRCRVSPVPLAGKATRAEKRGKLTTMDMWIAQPVSGGPMVPVKMTAKVQGIPLTLLLTSIN